MPTDADPTLAAIEAMARAMKPKHFAIFERGFTARNIIEQKAFLNAEKVVKRARKDAALAFHALHGIVRVVPIEATKSMFMACCAWPSYRGLRGDIETANKAGDLTRKD